MVEASAYHKQIAMFVKHYEESRIGGHRLLHFSFKEVVNISIVGQSAQPWICNVVFDDC